MKAVSRILNVLLTLVILICGIILLCSICPPVANFFSSILAQRTDQATQEPSSNATVDIEELLKEIESRTEPSSSKTAIQEIDLGLVNDSVITSLDSYYSEIVAIITGNHAENTELKFRLLLGEDLFDEWYTVNYNNSNDTDAYELSLDYEHLESGAYIISHSIIFK